ncbi:MAG: rhomboid family intramembrane serine protease [Actinomycetota bacterium]|nr:rhomboid family intramembrane serine protease [Actinomycetota bacterium]
MFFLWMFGDNVEDVLGSGTFLVAYLLSGAAASGTHLAMSSASDLPLIGASGAISGILGVYVVFFPKVPTELSLFLLLWEVKTLQVTAAGAVGAWFGEQLVLAWVTAVTGLDRFVGVAFWAHVGGLLTGAALAAGLVRLGYIRRYTSADGVRNPLLGYVRSSPRANDRHPQQPTE